MRFMVIRKADQETEAGAAPTEALITQMLAYNQKMIDAGVMLEGAGLQRSEKGARVSFRNGKPTITDGPFAESKELIAGYSIIEVKSKEEALEWLKQWPPLDGHGDVQLELRQLFSPEDFGEQAVEQAKKYESNKIK
jgi:hypothetical protein